MDQTTHNVRRANWLTIITQCQERPEGISVKQWLSDNGVKEWQMPVGTLSRKSTN